MAKKVTKIENILGDDVAVTEEYYLNNKNLPKSTSTFAYTPKMKEEMRKCRKDIVYFAEKYFFINGMYGKEIIKLFGKQKKILGTIQNNKKTLLVSSRQWGKCLAGSCTVRCRLKFFPIPFTISTKKLFTLVKLFNLPKLFLKKLCKNF